MFRYTVVQPSIYSPWEKFWSQKRCCKVLKYCSVYSVSASQRIACCWELAVFTQAMLIFCITRKNRNVDSSNKFQKLLKFALIRIRPKRPKSRVLGPYRRPAHACSFARGEGWVRESRFVLWWKLESASVLATLAGAAQLETFVSSIRWYIASVSANQHSLKPSGRALFGQLADYILALLVLSHPWKRQNKGQQGRERS